MFKEKRWFSLSLAAVSAFCLYTCMYAFRKPFSVADYKGLLFAHIDYKVWLVIAQTIGYTISKFFGIKFIGELKPEKRKQLILLFLAIGWISLLFFAITPAPYNIIFILINGFPLGVIYGLVFSYLEGRKATELLGAVLATSFIFASGFTQSVGKYILLYWHIDQWWMPFVTGSLFIIPTVIFTFILNATPSPTLKDIEQRTERKPMNKKERIAFIRHFLPGLILLIFTYVLLTIIRDYRSNFASNIWSELGLNNSSSIFLQSEIPASLVTLLLMGMLVLIKNNVHALFINHLIIISGLIIALFSTALYLKGIISPFWWMTWVGIGLYMGYVPFNCMLFDRLIATFKYVSNAGFIIYLADSFGYLGSDLVLVAKNFMKTTVSWSNFFADVVLYVSVIGIILTIFSMWYLQVKYSGQKQVQSQLKYV